MIGRRLEWIQVSVRQLTLWLVLFGGSTGLAQQLLPVGSWERPLVHRQTYDSESGGFSFQVDPSDRYGEGPSSVELRREDQTLWSRELAYTPRACAVSSLGVVAAAAAGPDLQECVETERLLRLVLFDPEGLPRMETLLATRERPSLHSGLDSYPVCRGVLFLSDEQVVAFRLDDGGLSLDSERWRAFDAETGEVLRMGMPLSEAREARHLGHMLSVLAIPKTDLVLLQIRLRRTPPGNAQGISYQLVDGQGFLRWRWDDPKALQSPEYSELELQEALRTGVLVPNLIPGGFSLPVAAEQVRVHYFLTDSSGEWAVSEVAREPLAALGPERFEWLWTAETGVPVREVQQHVSRESEQIWDGLWLNGQVLLYSHSARQVHAMNEAGEELWVSTVPNAGSGDLRALLRRGANEFLVKTEWARGVYVPIRADGVVGEAFELRASPLAYGATPATRALIVDGRVLFRPGAQADELEIAQGLGGRWMHTIHDVAITDRGHLLILESDWPGRLSGCLWLTEFDGSGRVLGELPIPTGRVVRQSRLHLMKDWILVDVPHSGEAFLLNSGTFEPRKRLRFAERSATGYRILTERSSNEFGVLWLESHGLSWFEVESP